MSNNLVIYEQFAEDFGPLTLTRPVCGLRVGTSTLAEKIAGRGQYGSAKVHLITRPYLAGTVPQVVYFKEIFARGATVNDPAAFAGGGLFVDGAVIASLSTMPPLDGPNEIGVVKEAFDENGKPVERRRVAYARLDAAAIGRIGTFENVLKDPDAAGVPVKEAAGITVAAFPWSLIILSCKAIEAEFKERNKRNTFTPDGVIIRGTRDGSFISEKADVFPGAQLDLRGGSVYIGENVEVQSSVLLDARGGAIIIEDSPGDKTIIQAGSQIYGPAVIGPANQIKQATVREGSSFGPACRIGGEIEESIIIGYSNKQHYGFMGHAVIGEWVNWGAGSTNSDLKNDYSNVEVELSRGRRINSRQNKTVGCYFGDHTKTALGAFFNTGSVAGIMSNILMNQVTEDKYLPHFAIYDNGRIIINRAALKTAETVMSRRGVPLTPEYKAMMDHLAEQFRAETREMWKATQKPKAQA